MIAKHDMERELYEARLKAQRDLRSMQIDFRAEGVELGLREGRQQGRREGRQEGIETGRFLGEIHSYQKLLAEPLSPDQELREKSPEELRRMAEELAQRVKGQ